MQALLDLVGEGVLQPTAEQVAERAGVGIRTVFRHFSDMDSLFAEMNERLTQELLPVLLQADRVGGIEKRARNMIELRTGFFERVAPYKRAEILSRWRSEFLSSRHAEFVRRMRSDLLEWLPEFENAPPELVEALDLATSFAAWDRLRVEQRLGRARAQAAVERTVLALLRAL